MTISKCRDCEDGVCAACSQSGVCPNCRQSAEETAKSEQAATATLNFYTDGPSGGGSLLCARCGAQGDLLSCMTCDKFCCIGCADKSFVTPFRRCRLCPAPVGGELQFVMRKFEEENRLKKASDLTKKKVAAMEALKSAKPSATCRTRHCLFEVECAVCRCISSSSSGFCMECCRNVCEDCAFDSTNCVRGQLVCEGCKGTRTSLESANPARMWRNAFQLDEAEAIAVGSAVTSLQVTSTSLEQFTRARTLLPLSRRIHDMDGADVTAANATAPIPRVLRLCAVGVSAIWGDGGEGLCSICGPDLDVGGNESPCHEAVWALGSTQFGVYALLSAISRHPDTFRPFILLAQESHNCALPAPLSQLVLNECSVLTATAAARQFAALQQLSMLHFNQLVTPMAVAEATALTIPASVNELDILRDVHPLTRTVSATTAFGANCDLNQLLEALEAPLPEKTIVCIILQIAEALSMLHTGGVATVEMYANANYDAFVPQTQIHGNVSPANIRVWDSCRVTLMLPNTSWSSVPPLYRLINDEEAVRNAATKLLTSISVGADSTTIPKILSTVGSDGSLLWCGSTDVLLSTQRQDAAYLDRLRVSVISRAEKLSNRSISTSSPSPPKCGEGSEIGGSSFVDTTVSSGNEILVPSAVSNDGTCRGHDPSMRRSVPGFYATAPDELLFEYMAPEMRVGHGTTKSDVWSLGVVMFAMAALPEYPLLGIEGELVDLGSQLWRKEKTLLPLAIHKAIRENFDGYSPVLVALICSMVSPNPDERPEISSVLLVLRRLLLTLENNDVD